MTPRAAQIKAERARRKAAVIQNMDRDDAAQRRQTRAVAQMPRDPTEEAARAIFGALQNGSESARHYAAQLLKHAPDAVRAAVMQLADVESQWKQRRSRKPNGF